MEKKSLTSDSLKIKKEAKLDKEALCLEIQLILRYLNFFSEKTERNNRLFYNYEERLLQQVFK